MSVIEVYSLPYNDSRNPYFELWRSAMRRHEERVVLKPLDGSLPALALKGLRTASHTRVICIHWSTVLYGSAYVLRSLALLCVNIPALVFLRFFGKWKVVWVIHNAQAHDYPHPLIDRTGRFLLGMSADTIVAQQRSTRERFAKRYPRKRVVYIPHGNYVGAYGPERARESARAAFRFGKEIVLLSLGTIRPYKRNEEFILAVRNTSDPNLKLLIVGKGQPEYVSALQKLAGDDERILIENRFVPDSEIPEYLAAADYGIFYYGDSELTSGALILAFSYGLPVITRQFAGAEDIDGDAGYLFADRKDLCRLLSRKLPPRSPVSSSAARATVASAGWDAVAEKYERVFCDCTDRP